MGRRIRHINPAHCGAQIALDARFIAGVANGSPLSSWTSRAPATISVTQGTGGNQPTFRASAVNGRPAVEFDGLNDVMVFDAAAAALTNNVASCLFLMAISDTNLSGGDANHVPLFLTVGGVANARVGLAIARTSGILSATGRRLDSDVSAASSAGLTISASAPAIVSNNSDWANNQLTIRRNGVTGSPATYSSGAGSTSATNSLQANLGAISAGGSRFPGHICVAVGFVPLPSQAVANRIRHHVGYSFHIATR
jgi:hypothetical protein